MHCQKSQQLHDKIFSHKELHWTHESLHIHQWKLLIFKGGEKRRDERFAEMAKDLEKHYQLKMLQVENETNKYELECER